MAQQASRKKSYQAARSKSVPYPSNRDVQKKSRGTFLHNVESLPTKNMLEKCFAACDEAEITSSKKMKEDLPALSNRSLRPTVVYTLKDNLLALYKADDQKGFFETVVTAIREGVQFSSREYSHFHVELFSKSPCYTVPLIIFLRLKPMYGTKLTEARNGKGWRIGADAHVE